MDEKLTPKEKRLLEWVQSVAARSDSVLESQIVGSGLSSALNELLIKRKVKIIEHPTVREGAHHKYPASAVTLF